MNKCSTGRSSLVTVLRAPEASLGPGRRLEPAHLHGVRDTSVHLVLPTVRGAELMVYRPRDLDELMTVVSIIEESLAFARGDVARD